MKHINYNPSIKTIAKNEIRHLLYKGKVSFYSRDGCLGCSPSLHTGSGEDLDDTKNTIAIPCEDVGKIKYGTYVRITNLDNGKTTRAKINDCGGFSKYNRVADLTLALKTEIEAKTDVSEIKIEQE